MAPLDATETYIHALLFWGWRAAEGRRRAAVPRGCGAAKLERLGAGAERCGGRWLSQIVYDFHPNPRALAGLFCYSYFVRRTPNPRKEERSKSLES